jgi:hypothetical protein
MRVKYVGLRPTTKDVLYGTGIWTTGHVKDVPAEVAEKMIRHVDVYVPDCTVAGLVEESAVEDDVPPEAFAAIIDRIKVRFLDSVLEAGELALEIVEGLGVLMDEAIAAETTADDIEKVAPEEKKLGDNEEDLQGARDLVATMEKEGLDNFAATHFKVKLHHNMTVENARAKVITLIDQFGMS